MEQEKTKTRKKKNKSWPVFLLLFVLAVVAVALSPACNVHKITVEGNQRVSSEQILNAMGEVEGRNLFRISPKKLEQKIQGVPYVDEVSVHRKLPNRLIVQIKEAKTALFIPFDGEMLCITKKGKVINCISPDNAIGAPVVEGVTTAGYEIGKKLEPKDADSFKLALEYLGYLEDAKLRNKTTAMDVSNPDNVTFTINYHLLVEFGPKSNDVEYKMNFLKKAMEGIDTQKDGVLNLRFGTYEEVT